MLFRSQEGISPEALMEECLHDVEQAAYHPCLLYTSFPVLDNGQNDSGAPQGYAKDSRQVYFLSLIHI